MLLADVVVGSGNAALQDAEIILDRVRMHEAAVTDIFTGPMIDGPVAYEILAHLAINASLVCHNIRGL